MRAAPGNRGFALVGAVFALVVIATLVAGAFFAAVEEEDMGKNAVTYRQAFGAAEGSIADRVGNWSGSVTSLNALAVGDSVTYLDTMPDRRSTAATTIERLNGDLYLIKSTGESGLSRRTLGAIAKLELLQLDMKASLTTRSSLKIGGSSFIDGTDTDPSGWGCPPVADTLAAVRTPDSTQISTSGCSNYTCLSGSPKIQQDTTVKDSTFFSYGGLNYDDLAAMATKVYNGNTGPLNDIGPVGDSTSCTTSVQDNWGEPYHDVTGVAGCYNYFPIIHVTGSLSLTGGHGQGILLVDSNLTVQGGFEFYGPVIVKGHFATAGTGGHFNGGVLSADVDLQLSSILGNAVITYSSCSIARAIEASASGRLLKERRWMDLTQ